MHAGLWTAAGFVALCGWILVQKRLRNSFTTKKIWITFVVSFSRPFAQPIFCLSLSGADALASRKRRVHALWFWWSQEAHAKERDPTSSPRRGQRVDLLATRGWNAKTRPLLVSNATTSTLNYIPRCSFCELHPPTMRFYSLDIFRSSHPKLFLWCIVDVIFLI